MVEAQPQDVVVTGLGIVSPIGIGRGNFWQSLVGRSSGVAPLVRDFGTLPVKCGGELKEFDARGYVTPRKAIKLMCREIQSAFAAASLAVDDAQLDVTATNPDRFGVTFGSEMLYGIPDELAPLFQNSVRNGQCDMSLFGERFSQDLFPLWMLSYLPNMAACHIAIGQQAFGANNTIVQGDASSLLAIIEALSVIRRGWCDVMVCGGTGTNLNLIQRVYLSNDGVCLDSDVPSCVPRPFDRESTGEVLGEGAGALVIETRAHAESRGATPLARILGYGASFGAEHEQLEGASEAGIQRALRLAIQRTECEKSEIDHVNAHGVGRPDWDRREARAIHAQVPGVPVMAPKSYFGNLGAGSGIVEAAVSILGFVEGHVPGTLNHQRTDPQCPIHVVGADGKACERPLAVLLNQSRSGQVAVVVIGRED